MKYFVLCFFKNNYKLKRKSIFLVSQIVFILCLTVLRIFQFHCFSRAGSQFVPVCVNFLYSDRLEETLQKTEKDDCTGTKIGRITKKQEQDIKLCLIISIV